MGAGSSSDSGADNEPDDVIGREYGFRVHRVEPGSPGAEAGLQSILDYIVVANGVRLNQDDASFVRMIAESKDKPLKLTVFDTHTLRTRETTLTPNDTWGGSGLVGITIRFDLAQSLSKHTLHVLDVFEDSPASAAQLDAFNDYILGVGDLLFDGPDEFGEIVLHNEHRPLRLFVYSVRTQLVREVVITPDRGWGGDGCLGCGVGGGYLHTLPRRRETRPHKARPDAAAPASAAHHSWCRRKRQTWHRRPRQRSHSHLPPSYLASITSERRCQCGQKARGRMLRNGMQSRSSGW
jgi:hypothetical protein